MKKSATMNRMVVEQVVDTPGTYSTASSDGQCHNHETLSPRSGFTYTPTESIDSFTGCNPSSRGNIIIEDDFDTGLSMIMQNLPKEDITVTMGNSMPMELGQLGPMGPMGPMGPLQALESVDSTDAIPPAVSMAPMTTISTIVGGATSMSAMSSSSSTLPMSDPNVGLQIQIEEWDKPVAKSEVGNIINGSLEPSANDELSISDNVISREIGELESGWKRRRENSIGEPCKRTRASSAVQLQPRSKRQLSSEEHLQVPFSPSLEQPQQRPGNKFLKCFSILRTNYLNLCSTYNGVLVKYNDSQAERAKLKVQNEELKALMDGLLHEVNILRSRERRKKRQSCNGTWTQKLKIDA